MPVLDHIVIDVRDRIDAAEARFRALGFNLTPRGHHTLGSSNHLAMFATDYLELLGFGAGGAARAEIQSFPVGLNGLVFKTEDADRIHAHAQAAGLPILPVQAFSRPVTLGGETRDARFRTTRLDPQQVAMGRVYFCEHLTPELVWRPEWQVHPNGARAIARVIVATPQPERTAELFRGLFGPEAAQATEGRVIVAAGRSLPNLATPPPTRLGVANTWLPPSSQCLRSKRRRACCSIRSREGGSSCPPQRRATRPWYLRSRR
jgi:catechol 2,3-dioxygenase-like lactoylglutathione lyase family enzyme